MSVSYKKLSKAKESLRVVILVATVLVGVFLGFALSWVIQFKLDFLGATRVTFSDIVGLWATPALLLGIGFFYLGAILAGKIR